MIHIAIADNYVLARKGLCNIINSFKDFFVATDTSCGNLLINEINSLSTPPDICIFSIDGMAIGDAEISMLLKRKWPSIKVLILTAVENEFLHVRLIRGGVEGLISKYTDPEEFEIALRAIAGGSVYYTEYTDSITNLNAKKIKNSYEITRKEANFLAWCTEDLSYKEIAVKMNISTRTVESYRDNLLQKLKLKSRIGLVVFAIQHGYSISML